MNINTKDLRSKTKEELSETLKKTREELEKLSRSILSGEEKNVVKARKIRKNVARIVTVMSEMEVQNA